MNTCDKPCPHVMQARCLHCGREQYALNVWAISHAEAGCAWCGEKAPVLTDEGHYRDLVRAVRDRSHGE